MPLEEPATKRAVTFFDGQNLYHGAREAWEIYYPSYNVLALSQRLCADQGWQLKQVRFYTGVPSRQDDSHWSRWWSKKFRTMGRQGVVIFHRALRYREVTFEIPGGDPVTKLVGTEKGIDVRIALDIIRLAIHDEYDVALVFSQDQDLSEVADEIRAIAKEQERWIKMASAYPVGPGTKNTDGIRGTDWIEIDEATYHACRDLRDYR